MTVTFDARESDDGYQYIQIYANTTADKDHTDTGAKDGDPGSYNYARYVAGFTIDGNVSSTYYPYTFPVTSYDHNCGYHAHPWSGNSNGNLEQQYFKSNCRASDGRLIVPTDLSSLYVRMDASGNFGDTWYCQNLKAHIQAVDVTAPTVLDNNYKVSGGRHQKGAVIYVSVPFSEIVTVTGTPTLNTSWGVFNYHAGSGSNVLTFRGEISSTASGTLYASGIGTSNGNVRDLAGNSFTPFTKDIGISLDADYVWSTSDFNTLDDGSCEIYTKLDLRHLALMVNMNLNECDGLTFKQTQDITCDNTYIPIGYLVDNSSYWSCFKGTYDGQGHTVSGITISNTNYSNSHIALFGYVKEGTVKKVSLANSTFTGNYYVGGIVAHNVNGTVQECCVESTVTIKAGSNGASCHGGIVGDNYGIHAKVLGCVSAAKIQNNNKTDHQQCGGIAGYNYGGTIQDCLYTGTTIEAADQKGGIVGFSEGSNATFTNNYYTSVSIGGVNGSDQDGARRARTVTCGTGVSVWDLFTNYNVSGLTAIGTTALKSGSTIYSGEGQTLTLDYNGTLDTGTTLDGFSATAGTISDNTLTMPASDVTVSAIITDHWGIAGGADGSEEHPYLITTTAGIDLLAKYVNGIEYNPNDISGCYFELGADIAYDPTALDDNGENYTAIGISSTNSFCGSFDGKEHTISGIRINNNQNHQGLFGYIGTEGTVKNVTLADAVINGKGFVGGIVGHNHGGTIENCRVESTVSVNGTSYVGGIVGNNRDNGTIKDCYSAATVRGTGTGAYVGGIAGANHDSGTNYNIIQDCYSTATVSGTSLVGGIAGSNISNNTIKGCRVIRASVTATKARGGAIVGHNAANNTTNNYIGILSQNYYRNCTVTIGEGETATTATSGIGCGNTVGDLSTATDVTEMTYNSTTYYDGAREVYALTLGTDITATGGTVEISSTTYYKAGATVTLGYSGSLPAGFIIAYSVNGVTITGNTFEMPAADATVSAQLAVPYIDANGDEQICTNFTIIQSGSGQTLGIYTNDEAWYVVTGDVNASATLTFRDQSAHLIVCDGATLNAQSASYGISAHYNLTIYGQSGGTGSIVARNNAAQSNGIDASGNITINGGTVNATGQIYGIYAYDGGNITINGGTVSATGQNCGIYASGNITLGWTNADDRITASSYNRNPIVKEGQAFTDGTNIYSGTLTTAQRNALAGKTLQPVTYSYALAANEHDGNYWTTFYSSEAGYKINNEENACAYTATYSSETLTLHKLGKVIPAGTAVVIVGEDNSIGMTFSQEAAENTVGNDLHGVDVRTEKSTLGSGTFCVMGKQNGNFGFFEYTGDYMPARKAYLLVSGGALVQGFKMEFEDDADGLKDLKDIKDLKDLNDTWFDLNGRKLDGKPSERGIYIHNGRKEAVK